eukprot:TRINITY_DN31142_c0_g1_i2.p2 TRINITY_DN31142_c0_g1~~TRINITY_DN31142_c0_g1_i2.p2  ORF type:complete len:189 (+),score=35.70 TRINITY_DN31142_c0_g1_i2:21-587(+)
MYCVVNSRYIHLLFCILMGMNPYVNDLFYGRRLIFFFFFFKQKTAYEMQRGLVGSEMCIRDRLFAAAVAVYSASLWLIAAYLGLSVFTFIIYAWDKRAAQKGEWRISENTLHILSLAGGWPGALFAQKQLRHKSQKQPFKALLWITIVINSGAFAWSFTPPGTLFLQQLENKLLQLFWIANGLSNHLS